jgi:hypothetical protein
MRLQAVPEAGCWGQKGCWSPHCPCKSSSNCCPCTVRDFTFDTRVWYYGHFLDSHLGGWILAQPPGNCPCSPASSGCPAGSCPCLVDGKFAGNLPLLVTSGGLYADVLVVITPQEAAAATHRCAATAGWPTRRSSPRCRSCSDRVSSIFERACERGLGDNFVLFSKSVL